MLAQQGPNPEVRTQSIQWLRTLAKPEEWGEYPEVSEAIVTALLSTSGLAKTSARFR